MESEMYKIEQGYELKRAKSDEEAKKEERIKELVTR
jgi:hypothetical protein